MATTPVQGMQVESVGISSGWTMGSVTQICADETNGLGHKVLCTGRASYSSAQGDSGAPVFYWWWFYGGDTVELIGLNWGATGSGTGRYSPWSQVVKDLGSVYIQYPYFP